MFLKFQAMKTLQAMGVVARQHRAHIAGKLRILKLLYIADRESIRDAGWPILGSRMVAMDHGPLHSSVLDLINGEHIDEPLFAMHFEMAGHLVAMVKDPGVDQLSRAEIEKLQEVSRRYAEISDWELAQRITHGFPEWQSCYREGTSTPIPIEEIIDAVGRSGDKESILDDLRHEYMADAAFGAKSL
jgi:uncharacterized phage-associated protein